MQHNEKSITKILQKQGYRLTPQRAMILHAIEHKMGHFSAEEIYAQIKPQYPQLNISTVYRTLELLKNTGLVTETNFGDGRARYHTAEKGHHHHLVCQHCGAITNLDNSTFDSLRKQLKQKYNFKADLRHVAIFGTCAKCKK